MAPRPFPTLIKDLPPDARPREKLLAQGPAALADAELVALLLRTGLKGVSVLQLAQQDPAVIHQMDHASLMTHLCHALLSSMKTVRLEAIKQPNPPLQGEGTSGGGVSTHARG